MCPGRPLASKSPGARLEAKAALTPLLLSSRPVFASDLVSSLSSMLAVRREQVGRTITPLFPVRYGAGGVCLPGAVQVEDYGGAQGYIVVGHRFSSQGKRYSSYKVTLSAR